MRKFLTLFTVLLLSAALALISSKGYSQTNSFSGKVTDDQGNGIPNISVQVKGAKLGTSTNTDGSFLITGAKSSKITLDISGVNYTSQSVSATSGIPLFITLILNNKNLEEVIITGVAGATSRKKMTVSVTKINEDRLSAVPAISMVSALTGKVAGVRTSTPSGTPGGSTDLLLRADNNLNNVGSSPLILLDGVILTGSLSDINADDVESMEVVKGAAASSLYGSRAGNGVISITTKRGNHLAMNSTHVTVRNEVGFQKVSKKLELSTHHPYALASDYQQFVGQFTKYAGVTYPAGYTGGGYNPSITGNRVLDTDNYSDNPYGVTNDQQDLFFKTGTNYTNFVGVSTRSEKTNMYASFENNQQQGVIAFTSGYKRQNFRLNVDQQIAPWLKLTTSNLFVNTTTNYPGGGGGIFFNIALAQPDINLLQPNPDGQPYFVKMDHWNGDVANPLYSLYKNKRDDKTRRWVGNYAANVKFTKWANLDLSHSIEIENYRYTSYDPKDTWKSSGGTAATLGQSYTNGGLYKYSQESNTHNTQVTLNMGNKFGDLDVKGKLSYLYENRRYESYDVSSTQLSYGGIPTFSNFTSINAATSENTEEKAQNYFAILSLDWKGKYLVDGMFRYDGSSLFGPESRWNPYYRISGAYRVSEDLHIPGIDELKIRAAYGTAGIRPGFNWQYETFNLASGVASAKQRGNINLKPSKTAETEVGLNVDFLKKFTFEATYATSLTTDQFINVPLIPFLNQGFSSQYQNAGTVKSNTLELSLGANWLKNNDFTWSTNIVFSKVNQKITELPIPPYVYGTTDGGGEKMFYVKGGENYGVMYGSDFVRSLDQMAKQLPAGKTIADYEVNTGGYVVAKGTQGKSNEAPIKLLAADGSLWYGKIGDGNPDFTMGIANTFKYKGISLYFLFDIKQGGDIYNGKGQWLTRDSRTIATDMSGVDAANKKTYQYFQALYNVNTPTKIWVEDGSFVKLREVALGYTFSPKSLHAFKGIVKGITAKIVGRNLLTITNYSGYDPEVGTIREPYDGTNKYPGFRNYAFSVSLDF